MAFASSPRVQLFAGASMLAMCLLSSACDAGGSSASGGDEGDARVAAILALTPDASRGADVFVNNCGADICHGADGNSGPATDLSTAAVLLSDAQLVTVILDGTGNMPPLGLADQEVADVVAYLDETFM